MSITFLVYNEDPDTAGIGAPADFTDQCCTMFEYKFGYIDIYGTMASAPNVWPNLDAVWTDSQFTDHSWVYFDGSGSQYIDEFTHPANDVVYITGSNTNGYNRPLSDLSNGTILKHRTVLPERDDWHVGPILIAAMMDRWWKLQA